ncbi:hypothetical protein W02_22350 [Nitrospira sp. KM1]|nr:hypothetical protein W02_22350 [Nitrospira sp. KM1]
MIQVSSEPSDAQVLSNGKPVGQTPVSFEADRGEALLIEVKKQGYETQTRVGSKKLSQVGLLDVIGGVFFLVPLLGLLSSGAWAHDPQQYGLTLEPVK